MRFFGLALLLFTFSSFTIWETNFASAKQKASSEHKYILLSFSGSDWCGPCIKMHHDYFENAEFLSVSEKTLVLVNADFPRQKKNLLSKPLQQQNNQLADQYNPSGAFPLTLLLNSEGKILKQWEGYPKMSVEEFITDIKKTTDAVK